MKELVGQWVKGGGVVGLFLMGANTVYNVNPGHRALIFDRRSGLHDKVNSFIHYYIYTLLLYGTILVMDYGCRYL